MFTDEWPIKLATTKWSSPLFSMKTYWGEFKDFFKNLVDKNSTDDNKN